MNLWRSRTDFTPRRRSSPSLGMIPGGSAATLRNAMASPNDLDDAPLNRGRSQELTSFDWTSANPSGTAADTRLEMITLFLFGDVRRVSGLDCYLPVRSRCLHPGQQQGRRWPSSSSSWVRRMRRSRVISCLASSTQQMNSLRARGVMSFQASSAVGLAISASRRSPGSLCTTPPGTRGLLTGPR